jgi:hypothetical protein
MDYSNHAALSLPLIGTLPHEVHREQRDDEVPSKTPETNESEASSSSSPYQDLLISCALFGLMFLHFGLIFGSDGDHVIDGIRWSTINVSIGLFIAATYLYRNALTDCGISNDVAMLLPEVIIVIAMALVFFYQVIAAFLLLAVGKSVMAFTVIVINSYRLWFIEDETVAEESENEESIV